MTPLTCLYCSQEFDRPNLGLDGPGGVRIGRPPAFCSDACRQADYRLREARGMTIKIPEPRKYPTEILCKKCGETRPIDDFYRHGGPGGKMRRPCRECVRAMRRKAYHERGGLKNVQRDNWARYGVTPEQYAEMHQQQGGLCAICRRPPGKRSLAIDHCHASGKVRALLCVHCNAILGHARDEAETLLSAVAYLETHSVDVTKPIT